MPMTNTTTLTPNSVLSLDGDNTLSAEALQSILANIISQPGQSSMTLNSTAASNMIEKTVHYVDLSLTDPADALELQRDSKLDKLLKTELNSHLIRAHLNAFKETVQNSRT